MKEAWEIRRASLYDVDSLAALCSAAVGPDDYVIGLLEDFVLRGVVHVALDGDKPVGMMHYSPTIDGSAWLGAARTHPGYRRRGVASALLESFAFLARRSGVRALRLWSAASNAAGNASVRSCGFREVARFSRMRRKSARGTHAAAPIPFDTDLVEEIDASPLARAGRGYVPYSRYFVPLTPANVHVLANAGAFHRVAGGIAVFSSHPEDHPDESLEFGLVAGDAVKVLEALPSAAAARGMKELRAFVPHDGKILEAAKAAGFVPEEWGHEAVLYERALEVGPTSYRKRRTYAEIAAGKKEGYAALALLVGKHDHGHAGPHEDRWNR